MINQNELPRSWDAVWEQFVAEHKATGRRPRQGPRRAHRRGGGQTQI